MRKVVVNFALLSAVFFVLAAFIFLPPLRGKLKGGLFEILALMLLILSVSQIVLVRIKDVEKPLRKYLLWIGYAALGIFISVIVHNLFYAIFGAEDALFFVLGLIVFPVLFVIGFIGSVICLLRD